MAQAQQFNFNLEISSSPSNIQLLSSTPKQTLFLVTKENFATDVTLWSADNVLFHAHKTILVSSVEYFKTMFTTKVPTSVRDEKSEQHHLDLASSTALSAIIQFAYGEKVELTDDNVHEILYAADCYIVKGLHKLCWRYFEEHISATNFYLIDALRRQLYCDVKINSRISKFIHSNMYKAARANPEVLLYIEIESLKEILQSDFLNVTSEHEVKDLILAWLSNVPEELKDSAATELMPLIRRRDLSNVPRIPQAMIFVFGGYVYDHSRAFECFGKLQVYDPLADSWLRCKTELPVEHCMHYAVVAVGNFIYLIGGMNQSGIVKSKLSRFNIEDCSWTTLGPMACKRARSHLSAVFLDGNIFAIGGTNTTNTFNYCDSYSIHENQWYPRPNMRYARLDAAVCVHRKDIYVAGGFRRPNTLRYVEVFTPATDTWTEIRQMPFAACSFAIVPYDKYVYALGGTNIAHLSEHSKIGCRMARYDTKRKRWLKMPKMPFPRMSYAAAIIGTKLYVMGGAKASPTSDVDIYDFEKDTWIPTTPLDKPRHDFSASVIQGATYLKLYSLNGLQTQPEKAYVEKSSDAT